MAWEASQGFLPDSQHKHLPAHTWKLQMSKLTAKGQTPLCGHLTKWNHLSAPLSCCCSPGDVTQGLHTCSSPGPSPISQQPGDKEILSLFDIRFTDWRKRGGKKKKKICFLTSCKLKKKKEEKKGLDHQQFKAWNASNTQKGTHEHRSVCSRVSRARPATKPKQLNGAKLSLLE